MAVFGNEGGSVSGGSGGRSSVAALVSAVNATTAGWGSTQDINATATGLTFSLPAVGVGDIAPTLKTLLLQNIGVNPVTLALTSGVLNSAVGLVMLPRSVWTIEAQTLTTANVSATNASQPVVSDVGTAVLSSSVSILAGNNSTATAIVLTGLTFTAQETATYIVSLSLHGNQTSATQNLTGVLVDTVTPAVAITGSETLISVPGSIGEYSGSNTFSFSAVAGRTYQARAFNTSGVATAAVISNTNGRSTLTWQKAGGAIPVSGTPTAPQGFALVNISNPSVVAPVAITSANAVGSTLLGGNLTTTSGNNGVICKAGKTYFIEAAMSIDNYGGANTNFPFASFDICSNMSTTVLPGSSTGRATMQNLQSTPSIGAGNNGGPRPSYAFFSPTVDTPVNVTIRTMGQGVGGAAITAVLVTGTMSVLEVGMTGTVVSPLTGAVNVNNTPTGIVGLYDVAATRLSGNIEFFEDAFLRMDFNAGLFRIAAVGTAKNVGVYGLDSSTASSMDAVASGAFPIGTVTPTANSLWKASFGSIAVGVFTIISDVATGSDYDDIQIYWMQMAEAGVKYRVSIMGGSSVGCIVERWNTDRVTLNTKITLPN
jgi:hypothetical protein